MTGRKGRGPRTAKYEVWGRKGRDEERQRLAFGFSSEREARTERARLMKSGFLDVVIVQRPPRYAWIKGLQNAGRDSQKR